MVHAWAAPRHVGSSRPGSNPVPCTGRQIPTHCTTREVPTKVSLSSKYTAGRVLDTGTGGAGRRKVGVKRRVTVAGPQMGSQEKGSLSHGVISTGLNALLEGRAFQKLQVSRNSSGRGEPRFPSPRSGPYLHHSLHFQLQNEVNTPTLQECWEN